MRTLAIVAALAMCMTSCAKQTGGKVVAPDIPVVQHKMAFTKRVAIDAKLGEFEDGRVMREDRLASGEVSFPVGDVDKIVSKAAMEAFERQGYAMNDNSGRMIRGRILDWRAEVKGEGLPTLSSEATLFVEVSDANGNAIYSGTYNGSRSSQFPVISESDIQESLRISMLEAINSLAEDSNLIRAAQ